MNRILKYMAVAGFGLSVSACEDTLLWYLPGPNVYFIQDEFVEVNYYDFEDSYTITVPVGLGGYYETATDVGIALDAAVLQEYNDYNFTDYQILPADVYSIPFTTSKIEAKERRTVFQIELSTEKVRALDPDVQYCIPLRLSNAGNVDLNDERNTVIIQPIMATSTISLLNTGRRWVRTDETSGSTLEFTFSVGTPFTSPYDVEFVLDTSNDALRTVNEAYGTYFDILPSGSYTLTGEPVLRAGESEVVFTLSVSKSALTGHAYSFPVVLRSASHFSLDEPENRMYLIQFTSPVTGTTSLDRSTWTAESSSGNEPLTKITDGDLGTFWESRYSSSGWGSYFVPFELWWELGADVPLCQAQLYRRQGGYVTDTKALYIEVSADGNDWYLAGEVDFGTDNNPGPHNFYFKEFNARYFKVTITESNRMSSSNDCANLAELYLFRK